MEMTNLVKDKFKFLSEKLVGVLIKRERKAEWKNEYKKNNTMENWEREWKRNGMMNKGKEK